MDEISESDWNTEKNGGISFLSSSSSGWRRHREERWDLSSSDRRRVERWVGPRRIDDVPLTTSRAVFLCSVLPTRLPTTPFSPMVPVSIPTTRRPTPPVPLILGLHSLLSLCLRGFLRSLHLCFEDSLVVVVRPTNYRDSLSVSAAFPADLSDNYMRCPWFKYV